MRSGSEGVSFVVFGSNQGRTGGFSFRLWPFLVALAVVLIDRLTKIYIRSNFNDLDSVQVVPGWFRLIHTENPGAAFGMLADGNPLVRGLVLVGISLVVLCFVANALLKRASTLSSMASRLGLSFILGGATGNLYDRVFRGTVTDFLEVYKGTWSFPAFNVADSAITLGAVFLLLDLLWPAEKPDSRQAVHPPSDA